MDRKDGVFQVGRLPVALPLLPNGRGWTGKLRILMRDPKGYVVAFDAEGIDSGEKQFIYDRTVMTPKQLKDWTGWEEPR